MELILNELSVFDLTGRPEQVRNAMVDLLHICKKANEDLGCNGLRLPGSEFFNEELIPAYTLNDWINDPKVNPTLKTLFLGLRRYPYFEDLDEERQKSFILSKFTLNEPGHNGHEKEVQGLANAWLSRTLSVSFCSHPVWSKSRIGLFVSKEEGESEKAEVWNTCSTDGIGEELIDWFRKENLPPLCNHDDVNVWFPVTDGYSISEKARNDLIYWYQQNQVEKIDKIEAFFKEIWISPFAGTGKVEPLSGDLSGWWSRRISGEHRLVYKFESNTLYVLSCRGHYKNLNIDT